MAFSPMIISVILLLALASFLAGSEAALNSVSRVAVDAISERSKSRGAMVARIVKDPARYLNVVLLVRKAAELTATVLVAEALIVEMENDLAAVALAISIMVVASYVIVGVGPRTLGKQNPMRWIVPASYISWILAKILGPVTVILIALGNALTPGKGFRKGPFSNEAELRDLVDQAHESGLVEESEHEMIHSVFELGDTMVRELMIPRTEMVWIEGDKNLRQGMSLFLRSGYSRIPVVGEDVDSIIGIAYIKDIVRRVHDHPKSETSENISDHLRQATFVPESKNAAELLRQMQREQIHLAIVIDEYGGTAGIITIEDILEEIVGEIADEYDDFGEEFERINEISARIASRMHIEDLAEELEISIDDAGDGDIDTIGGYMAKMLGRVPIPGSSIEISGWRFTAERPAGRRHRITSILAEKVDQVSEVSKP
ncbi:MAG: hemolysin family protein [Candidatus Nanopelagicaceae bacterium]